jgi:quercetin dioxygenase-like cupin family protein
MIVQATSGDTHQVLGTAATIKLSSEHTDQRLGVVEHNIPRDAGPPPHFHDHADELLYVLEGTFEVVAGDPNQWHRVETGAIVHVPAGTIHTARCVSNGGRLLSVYTPGGDEAFFREIDAVDQSDLGAVMALAQRHGMSFPAPATA